ncbi:MAG: DUF3365 domain-containing protein [Nitrospinaceae bacterium]
MFSLTLRCLLSCAIGVLLLFPCESSRAQVPPKKIGVPPRLATDYIHSVIQAGRTFYSRQIVERLGKAISLPATENWEAEDALPLPAQFLILSSQVSNARGIGMKYRLISLSPLNEKNFPQSELEKIGLREVRTNPDKPFTWLIRREGKWNFQAIYPDRAVAQSCVSCHNSHPRSSRNDFEVGDVMGGIVINLPLRGYGKPGEEETVLVPPEIVADYVHSVIESDRTVYSRHIVDRLQNKKIVDAAENWRKKNALPLPAQFLLNVSLLVKKNKLGIDFRLISLWPINIHNGAANEFERVGLESVIIHPLRPYIGKMKVGNTRYFQAVYPDFAITPACVKCHNSHSASPKKDFKLNDIMGGIVVSFPIRKTGADLFAE